MQHQPKSYCQFAAGAVTAALVGLSISPITTSAAANFTDIEENSHKDAILSLTRSRNH